MHTEDGSRHPKVQELPESVSNRHPPDLIDEFAEELAYSLPAQFPNEEMAAKLRAYVRHRNDMDPNVRLLLVKELQALARRASGCANQLAEGLDVSAILRVVEPRDEHHHTREANEADARTAANGDYIADIELCNTQQAFNTGNRHARPVGSLSKAKSRISVRSSS